MAAERMTPLQRTRRVVLALLCVSLVSTRVDAAHLHLCLDGQEPIASVRTATDRVEQLGAQAPHNDRDVALASDVIGKQGKDADKQPVALPVAASQLPNLPESLVSPQVSAPGHRGILFVALPYPTGPPVSITT